MRKVTKTVAAVITAALCMTIPAMADIPGYEQVSSEKGDSVSMWTRDIGSGETLIDCSAFDASVSTDVNVRQFPGTDKPVVTVIGRECRIKVWGVTESGWAKVYCISKEGAPAFGFIKNTLLTEMQQDQPTKSQGALLSDTETESAGSLEKTATQNETAPEADGTQGETVELQSSDAEVSPEGEP